MNGRRGVVRSFDAAKARYTVEISMAEDEASGSASETLALKRDNLVVRLRVALSTPTDGSDATLPPELPAGASEGQLQGYDPETHCYAVRPKLESGEHGAELSVPAACCTLPEGAKAVVVGLQGAAEHNGKSAYVVGMHESGRYNVALSASQQLRLKRANLRA